MSYGHIMIFFFERIHLQDHVVASICATDHRSRWARGVRTELGFLGRGTLFYKCEYQNLCWCDCEYQYFTESFISEILKPGIESCRWGCCLLGSWWTVGRCWTCRSSNGSWGKYVIIAQNTIRRWGSQKRRLIKTTHQADIITGLAYRENAGRGVLIIAVEIKLLRTSFWIPDCSPILCYIVSNLAK